MSKDQANEEKKELEELRKNILEIRENADRNFHLELLKHWGIYVLTLGLGVVFVLILVILEHFKIFPTPIPVDPSKMEDIVPVIFQATVTINGLIIGFVPLISFFFIRGIREREHDHELDWKEEQKESKDEKLRLVNVYYNLMLMALHNVRSGVLRYTQTYVLVSFFLQFGLVCSYIVTIGYGMVALCVLINFILLYVVMSGLFPIISIALYEPHLRFVKYIIPDREVWKIEPKY